MPDPDRDRGKRGKCPCFVRLQYIRVAGDTNSRLLSIMAEFFLTNPYSRDLYHSALEIQAPDGADCPVTVIEMQEYVEGVKEQKAVGQITHGYFARGWFGTFISALNGPAYGIRKWKNGKIQDSDNPQVVHPNPQVLSTDCTIAQRILDSVSKVPTHRYSTDWTSNSVVSWLLQNAGLNPQSVSPPVHGITPGWREGIVAAGG